VANWKRIITTSDFSETQIQDLQDLVFTNPTVSLTVSPTSFEKGVQTDVNFTFTATEGNDTFIASSGELFTGTNNITNDDLGASGTITVNNAINSISRKFRANFTQEGIINTANKSSVAHIPQYYGVSSTDDWDGRTYSNVNETFTKVIQSSAQLPSTTGQFLFSPNLQRVHFFSKTSGLTVKDSNGFPQTDFTETQISLKLDNGNPQTMYHYMSGVKTLTNFGYELD